MSLADDVYKSTTVSEEKFSVMESVKKAFNLIGNTRTQGPYIVTEEDGIDKKQIALLRYEFLLILLSFSGNFIFTSGKSYLHFYV